MTHDATNLAHLAQQAQHFFRVPGGDIVEGFPPRRPLGHCSREEKKKREKKPSHVHVRRLAASVSAVFAAVHSRLTNGPPIVPPPILLAATTLARVDGHPRDWSLSHRAPERQVSD